MWALPSTVRPRIWVPTNIDMGDEPRRLFDEPYNHAGLGIDKASPEVLETPDVKFRQGSVRFRHLLDYGIDVR